MKKPLAGLRSKADLAEPESFHSLVLVRLSEGLVQRTPHLPLKRKVLGWQRQQLLATSR